MMLFRSFYIVDRRLYPGFSLPLFQMFYGVFMERLIGKMSWGIYEMVLHDLLPLSKSYRSTAIETSDFVMWMPEAWWIWKS